MPQDRKQYEASLKLNDIPQMYFIFPFQNRNRYDVRDSHYDASLSGEQSVSKPQAGRNSTSGELKNVIKDDAAMFQNRKRYEIYITKHDEFQARIKTF